MGDPLRPPAQKNRRSAAASARARPIGSSRYSGKRLVSRVLGPRPPLISPPKKPFPVPQDATVSNVHRVGSAVPGGVPTPLGDRVDRFDSQFPNLGAWVYLVRNAPLVLVMAARAAHTTSGGPCAPRRPDLPAPRPRQCQSHPSLSRTIADQSGRSLPRPPPPRRRVAI